MTKREPTTLTKTAVESLSADPAGNRYFPFLEVPQGLVVQVTPKGVKSFVLRYRFLGAQKIHTLGRWPGMNCGAARKAANTAWEKIHRGIDPNAEKATMRREAKAAITVAQLADRFVLQHMNHPTEPNKPSTILVHGRYIEKDIKPALGKMKVKEVTKTDVAEFLFKIQSAGKSTKAYTISRILSKMFAKAELWGVIEAGSNPARGQDQKPPRKRDRRLDDPELFNLGKTIRADEKEDFYTLAAIQLYLLTGMRRSELLGDKTKGIPPLTWDDVDREAGYITLKRHKTDKEKGPRTIVLCSAALDLMKALYKKHMIGNPCVIPGSTPGNARSGIHHAWHRIRTAAGIQDVRLHDLRRTFVSVGSDLGLPDYFADAQVGHAAGTVTETYRRVGVNPLFDAVEAIGARIAGLLAGTIDPVKEAEERAQAKADAKRNA